jgi:hypothetical protein
MTEKDFMALPAMGISKPDVVSLQGAVECFFWICGIREGDLEMRPVENHFEFWRKGTEKDDGWNMRVIGMKVGEVFQARWTSVDARASFGFGVPSVYHTTRRMKPAK